MGLDRECIEARSPAFLRTWYLPAEVALVGADPVAQTVAWTVKEAVLKLLGTGMALSPLRVEVVALRPRSAEVRLHGEAAERAAELGLGPVFVGVQVHDGVAVATAFARAARRLPRASVSA